MLHFTRSTQICCSFSCSIFLKWKRKSANKSSVLRIYDLWGCSGIGDNVKLSFWYFLVAMNQYRVQRQCIIMATGSFGGEEAWETDFQRKILLSPSCIFITRLQKILWSTKIFVDESFTELLWILLVQQRDLERESLKGHSSCQKMPIEKNLI